MTDRELMQEILEAMEHLHRTGDTQVFDLYAAPEIIPALRERLAQPEQEPVACLNKTQAKAILDLALDLEKTGRMVVLTEGQERSDFAARNRNIQCALEDALRNATTPPAAAQRTWVGLTKADINEIWKGEPMLLPWDMTRTLAIEQRLKEKNT